MWSEQLIRYSRDSPPDKGTSSSASSYSSSILQQMLKINIDEPKHLKGMGLTVRSTKPNSSYRQLRETRSSNIQQTLQKFDKKYVNSVKAEHKDESSLSSLDKMSLESLQITTKSDRDFDTDVTDKKEISYASPKYEEPAVTSFSDIGNTKNKMDKIRTDKSAYLAAANKNPGKVQYNLIDTSYILSPDKKSQNETLQNTKIERSIVEEISNESVNSKPYLKVTVLAKSRNKLRSENENVMTSETVLAVAPEAQFIKDKGHLDNIKTRGNYSENKMNSSSASTIHTEASVNFGSSADAKDISPKSGIQEKATGIPKTQQKEDLKMKILPFKVLTLDDLMDESQLSSKIKRDDSVSRDAKEAEINIKLMASAEAADTSVIESKRDAVLETDEEIEEILEDSEFRSNTITNDNSSNKLANSYSSVTLSNAKNFKSSMSNNDSDSLKSSEELVSIKKSLSSAAKSENRSPKNVSIENSSSLEQESVKTLKPKELKSPKTFSSVSTQTVAKHNIFEGVNVSSSLLRYVTDKASGFSRATQTNTDLWSPHPDSQQDFHRYENESKLEQLSLNIMVNEILKQQIKLTKHFVESQQRMHAAYLTTVNKLSGDFKPVSLEETEQYLKANLPRRPD